MEINYDKEADAMYIEFRKGDFSKNKKIDGFTIIDLDKDNNILGIELLDASKKYNCISCLPHPFGLMHFTGVKKIDGEYNNKNKFKDGIGILKEINAIEIINGHLFKRGNLKAFDLAMEFDIAYTAGSDGHLRFDLGNVLTYSRSNSREEFLDSILKKKNFVYRNDKGALKRKLVSQTLALRKHIIHPVHYIRRFARYSKKKLAHE